MRNRYFVCYDVHDPQRLVQTHKKMRGYGDPVQYSVFVCDLNDKEMAIMKGDLAEILNLAEDKVLMINTGPVEKSDRHVSTMGTQINTEKEATIVI